MGPETNSPSTRIAIPRRTSYVFPLFFFNLASSNWAQKSPARPIIPEVTDFVTRGNASSWVKYHAMLWRAHGVMMDGRSNKRLVAIIKLGTETNVQTIDECNVGNLARLD
jgi:hypothetical protein